ncbi:AMP-binding protein [Roseiterribacter gracilis]|uniref:Propionyl-CoA synthetase n=1 Tax=Roseiterribacter gracilis TaxID=2812848 RepID=A0A8S8XB64_9PROT|nr:propionyl-CoA synthetase [Rhodospirillales bacterium TMPK1]
MDYASIYRRSLSDPEGFWAEEAGALDWSKRWDRVLTYAPGKSWTWFDGATTNICGNALDRHLPTRHNQIALIHDSAYTGEITRISYRELHERVAQFAGALAARGVGMGDRVLIYMPNIPEAPIAMLACARIGAIHSVVFGGFAARELASRIADAKPRWIVAASCGLEPGKVLAYMPAVEQAIEISGHKIDGVVVLQRHQCPADLKDGRDVSWDDFVRDAKPVDCTQVPATHPLYTLYTSGTTGQPKGIVRDTGGYQVSLVWSIRNLFNIAPGEVFWTASDVGWVVGHSYMVYAPLLIGATTVLYEGKPVGTPDAGQFWRVAHRHKVVTLFTAPTAIRGIKRDDPDGKFIEATDLTSLRALFVAGERCDPATVAWASNKLCVPVIDHWWQTETGWPICGNPLGIKEMPIKPGSTAVPMPGWDVRALDPNGEEVAPGETGAIVCKLPLPPGAANTLWNAPERWQSAYLDRYPGYYATGDAGFIDEDGYVHVMTRTDDVINVAGHRLSTGAIEEVVAMHPDVAECAVVGILDQLKGQIPLGLVVLKSGTSREPTIVCDEIVRKVRDEMGAVVAFKQAIVVPRLPKTRSGKILRGTIVKIADRTDYTMPATIEDPTALTDIETALRKAGIGG